MNATARIRAKMVETLRSRGIIDSRVLEAMARIPRELFVGPALGAQAYSDSPLPIGEKQTISQPYIIAAMIQALELQGHERVLEIGTGSGYMTAILASVAAKVYSIERHGSLSMRARSVLEGMGFHNVALRSGDGTLGWREFAPFDAVIVSAAGPDIPPLLVEQLQDGGRLVIPVGPDKEQQLLLGIKEGEGLQLEALGDVRFVPLIGKFGWDRNSTGS